MRRVSKRITHTLIITLTALIAAACERHGPMFVPAEGTVVTDTGMVTWIDADGGFYGIVNEHGVRYDPSTLPMSLKKDAVEVRFIGRIAAPQPGDRDWGYSLEIIRIEEVR